MRRRFFALLGLPLGGYSAFKIMRQVAQRVAKLALLDTSERPDNAELTARRRAPMAQARAGKSIEVADESFVFFLHPDRHGDVALREVVRAIAEETGVEAYLRQQPDARPTLSAIRCPTLMLVGEQDNGTPAELARENCRRDRRRAARHRSRVWSPVDAGASRNVDDAGPAQFQLQRVCGSN